MEINNERQKRLDSIKLTIKQIKQRFLKWERRMYFASFVSMSANTIIFRNI